MGVQNAGNPSVAGTYTVTAEELSGLGLKAEDLMFEILTNGQKNGVGFRYGADNAKAAAADLDGDGLLEAQEFAAAKLKLGGGLSMTTEQAQNWAKATRGENSPPLTPQELALVKNPDGSIDFKKLATLLSDNPAQRMALFSQGVPYTPENLALVLNGGAVPPTVTVDSPLVKILMSGNPPDPMQAQRFLKAGPMARAAYLAQLQPPVPNLDKNALMQCLGVSSEQADKILSSRENTTSPATTIKPGDLIKSMATLVPVPGNPLETASQLAGLLPKKDFANSPADNDLLKALFKGLSDAQITDIRKKKNNGNATGPITMADVLAYLSKPENASVTRQPDGSFLIGAGSGTGGSSNFNQTRNTGTDPGYNASYDFDHDGNNSYLEYMLGSANKGGIVSDADARALLTASGIDPALHDGILAKMHTASNNGSGADAPIDFPVIQSLLFGSPKQKMDLVFPGTGGLTTQQAMQLFGSSGLSQADADKLATGNPPLISRDRLAAYMSAPPAQRGAIASGAAAAAANPNLTSTTDAALSSDAAKQMLKDAGMTDDSLIDEILKLAKNPDGTFSSAKLRTALNGTTDQKLGLVSGITLSSAQTQALFGLSSDEFKMLDKLDSTPGDGKLEAATLKQYLSLSPEKRQQYTRIINDGDAVTPAQAGELFGLTPEAVSRLPKNASGNIDSLNLKWFMNLSAVKQSAYTSNADPTLMPPVPAGGNSTGGTYVAPPAVLTPSQQSRLQSLKPDSLNSPDDDLWNVTGTLSDDTAKQYLKAAGFDERDLEKFRTLCGGSITAGKLEVLRFGTDAQKSQLLPKPAVSEELAVLAFSKSSPPLSPANAHTLGTMDGNPNDGFIDTALLTRYNSLNPADRAELLSIAQGRNAPTSEQVQRLFGLSKEQTDALDHLDGVFDGHVDNRLLAGFISCNDASKQSWVDLGKSIATRGMGDNMMNDEAEHVLGLPHDVVQKLDHDHDGRVDPHDVMWFMNLSAMDKTTYMSSTNTTVKSPSEISSGGGGGV